MLLAFDTATTAVTVALHDGTAVVAAHDPDQVEQGGQGGRTGRHGELLAPGIESVLRQAGAGPEDLTAIAVGAGPGPYTGLRVGLVTARTMAWTLDIPVHAVCTLDILAAAVIDQGVHAEFLVASDARRKEVYVAGYRDGRRITGPEVAAPDSVATGLPVAGRGAVLYPQAFPHRIGPELPSAAVLADVVTRRRFELLDPEPLYLRRPDVMAPRAPKRVS